MEEVKSSKKKCASLKECLRVEVISTMTQLGLWQEDLIKEIPISWDSFNNFVIFNRRFFSSDCWTVAGCQIWQCVSNVFSGKSIAFQGKIQNDNFRSPNAVVVYGKSSWVEYTDNSIFYTWNIEFTMFCTGNVSERHRIANLDCEAKVVVDMFAGIGYFTLPYLVHAKARQVIACEWNPVSVEALKINLSKNNVAEKCVVLEGDVRKMCPRDVADHVNLGLIPSCEEYWLTGAEILKSSGGVLHVHGNVTSFTKNKKLFPECEKCLKLLSELTIDYSVSGTQQQNLCDFNVSFLLDKRDIIAKKLLSENVSWKRVEWFEWGVHVSHSFCELLTCTKGSGWVVTPTLIHRVKAYAPHIDHLVLDIHCLKYEDCSL